MITDALYSVLSADSELGPLVGDRIYPVSAPDGVDESYMVYQEFGRIEKGSFDQPIDQSRFRFFIYAGHTSDSPNYRQCRLIAKALKTAMDSFPRNVGSVCVSSVTRDSQSDTWDEPSIKHGVEADYIISFSE